jgi:hypothetical protein
MRRKSPRRPTPPPRLVHFPQDLLGWYTLEAGRDGISAVSRKYNLSRDSLTRALQGEPVREGTLLLFAARAAAHGFVPAA